MITKQQLDSIRFYMGDEEITNQMLGGPKAYNTINALLSSGFFDEVNKVKENRVLEIVNTQHLKQYLQNIVDILLAMEEFVKEKKLPLVTYRIDRYASLEALQQTKQLEGFYSTCTYGYLPQYAHIKKDVVLFEIHREEDVPYVDFETLFDHYAKKEEAELLLPPKAKVTLIEEVALSEKEKMLYYDMDHKEPVGKFRIHIAKPCYPCNNTYDVITSDESVKKLQECLQVFMKQENLSKEQELFYLDWKQQVLEYLGFCLKK